MNVQWRTAIYVTGYSTKVILDTRFDRRTCTHEQEHMDKYRFNAEAKITYRQIDRQIYRNTDRHTDKHKYRQTD